jgi:hypothetical protein
LSRVEASGRRSDQPLLSDQMSAPRRYIIKRTSSDKNDVKKGLGWLERKASLLFYETAGLYVQALDQLDTLAPVIGAAQARKLRQDRTITMGMVTLELLTDRSLPASFNGPILAVWPDDGQLRKIEELQPEHLCVVEWQESLIADWIADFQPEEDLANTTSSRPAVRTTNPVVEIALAELTTGATLDRAKLHPADRATTINTFKTLKANRETYVPAEIRAWAATNGWSASLAKELEALGQDILDGGAPQTKGRGALSADAIDRWRTKAAAGDAAPTPET